MVLIYMFIDGPVNPRISTRFIFTSLFSCGREVNKEKEERESTVPKTQSSVNTKLKRLGKIQDNLS